MENHEKEIANIFEALKNESLSQSERVLLRNRLKDFMHEHPLRAPMHIRIQEAFISMTSMRSVSMRMVPAVLSLVLVLGIGTSYAAQASLPGDALYPIKIHFNESVQGAVALSDTAQASWNAEKLERRLTEAEQLVAKSALTPEAQATLKTQIDAAANDFDRSVQNIAATQDDAHVAAVQSDLEASLIGHAEVLLTLSNTTNSDAVVQPILASVITKAQAVQDARAAHEARVALKKTDVALRTAAKAQQKTAVMTLSAVQSKASQAKKADATSTAEVADEAAAQASVTIQIGDQELQKGEYGNAFNIFQQAIRTAQTVQVHLDASSRLNTDIKVDTRSTGNSGTSIQVTSSHD